MVKKPHIVLTKNDIKLICYLHALKIAKTSQITRDIYPNQSRANTRKRLKLMRDTKLVSAKLPVEGDMSYEYSLTKKGLKLAKNYIPYELVENRTRSDCDEHDLALVDIRNKFLQMEMTKEYYCENQIQSYCLFDDDKNFKLFKEYRFDACAVIKRQDTDKYYFGIQFEQTQKSSYRYRNTLIQYQFENDIWAVFFIYKNEAIKKKVIEIENQLSRSKSRMMYFLSYDELINSKKELCFRNSNNKTIRLF